MDRVNSDEGHNCDTDGFIRSIESDARKILRENNQKRLETFQEWSTDKSLSRILKSPGRRLPKSLSCYEGRKAPSSKSDKFRQKSTTAHSEPRARCKQLPISSTQKNESSAKNIGQENPVLFNRNIDSEKECDVNIELQSSVLKNMFRSKDSTNHMYPIDDNEYLDRSHQHPIHASIVDHNIRANHRAEARTQMMLKSKEDAHDGFQAWMAVASKDEFERIKKDEPSGADHDEKAIDNDVEEILTTAPSSRKLVISISANEIQHLDYGHNEVGSILIGDLNSDTEIISPLSIRLLGPLALSKHLCPGYCVMGKLDSKYIFGGQHHLPEPSFHAVATFRRDTSTSIFPAITATISMALDCPISSPLYEACDSTILTPKTCQEDPVRGTIPKTMVKCKTLLEEYPESCKRNTGRPVRIVVVDPSDEIAKREVNDKEHFTTDGFRTKCLAHEMKLDSHIPRRVFGITEKGATPNKPKVHPDFTWHNEECSSETLSRRREAKDFHYIIENKFTSKDGGSPNAPFYYTTAMTSYKVKAVNAIRVDEYDKKEKEKAEAMEKKREQLLIDSKIAAASHMLEQSTVQQKKDIMGDNSRYLLEDLSREGATCSSDEDTLTTNVAKLFDMNRKKVQTCHKEGMFDKCNNIHIPGKVDASKVVKYELDENIFTRKPRNEIIKDLAKDRLELVNGQKRRKRQEDRLLDSDQQQALEQIMAIPLEKDESLADDEVKEKLELTVTKRTSNLGLTDLEFSSQNIAEREDLAFLSVKNANFQALERLLDEIGTNVDALDSFGNTLLIAACQQGNKKMAKFLLRRGANINAQNHSGNTILHYLYQYGHTELATYLLRKGADDSFLNADGLTCYEGVNRDNLEDEFD